LRQNGLWRAFFIVGRGAAVMSDKRRLSAMLDV